MVESTTKKTINSVTDAPIKGAGKKLTQAGLSDSESPNEPIGNLLDSAFDAAIRAKEIGILPCLREPSDDATLKLYLKKRRNLLIDLANTIDDSLIDSAIRTLTQLNSSFELASNEAKSVYADRLNGESAYDFITRTNPDYPRYQGKRIDGDVIEWLRINYRDTGYLDGVLFTRATLRKLDGKANESLKDWCRPGRKLPADLNIPLKKGQSTILTEGFTSEQIKAAASLAASSYK